MSLDRNGLDSLVHSNRLRAVCALSMRLIVVSAKRCHSRSVRVFPAPDAPPRSVLPGSTVKYRRRSITRDTRTVAGLDLSALVLSTWHSVCRVRPYGRSTGTFDCRLAAAVYNVEQAVTQ